MGRKKMEIRRLKSDEARQACFTRRRGGLFKKVSELSILCGVYVAAVVFSPIKHAFSFVHTSVEAVLGRLLGPALPPPGTAGGEETPLSELIKKHGKRRAQLDAQRARSERVKQRKAAARAENSRLSAWVDADVCQMMEDDLLAYRTGLIEVYLAAKARAEVLPQPLPQLGGPAEGRRASWGHRHTDEPYGCIKESDQAL